METHIRNFVIIAHIDSGKSTLADRLLELTGTVEKREMQPQYLDQLELERERGITIKMAPVRMRWNQESADYVLNLIDTPGHSDFGYEVSRALAAVEGAVLLVDGMKGIQAQTLANLRAARRAGLTVVGAVNKIDMALPDLEKVVQSLAELLSVPPAEILRVSAKTGQGVEELLRRVVAEVPPPPGRSALDPGLARGLIFDSLYDDHRGILAFVRLMDGGIGRGDEVVLTATGVRSKVKEVGYFMPRFRQSDDIKEGEIGYLATGLKEPSLVKIGDTAVRVPAPHFQAAQAKPFSLAGYREPKPVVFISFYPDGQTEFEDLGKALARLRLNDAALHFEPDANEALGRGYKVGFLGQLHFEITASRLEREFRLEFLTSFPSIAYRVQDKGREWTITQPQDFPLAPERAWEPMIKAEIVTPSRYLSPVVNLKNVFEMEVGEIKNFGENLVITARMPLRELIRDFDDRLKSVSAGFASFSYELDGEAETDAEKLEVLIAGEVVPALTRVVPRRDLAREARHTVERLKELLPKEQFAQALQASAGGRIIARETIPAMKKLLGNFGKTGGDRTRKMKLWRKQKRGKERLEKFARVNLSPEVFREILKK